MYVCDRGSNVVLANKSGLGSDFLVLPDADNSGFLFFLDVIITQQEWMKV